MQSAQTLIHNIDVKHSIYAGSVVFALYALPIALLLLFVGITWLSAPLFLMLCGIALYGVRNAYLQTSLLKLSATGYIEVNLNGELKVGFISRTSFYNGCFMSLNVVSRHDDFLLGNPDKSFFVVIYRDAVDEFEYRLLARMINFGHE